MLNIQDTIAALYQGVAQILPDEGLRAKLLSGKKLTVKLGMDPTAPDLHLGHATVLRKMRQFQDLGHNVVFLIGDFTARIGDPTGRSKTRPPLSSQDIATNMKTYFDQVGKILDASKVQVVYNAQWLERLNALDMVQLCAKVTLARLTEREDFAQRIANNESVYLHELLYPLFQAYDSVHLHADIELGGTDQTFNLLMGRFLQEQYSQEQQVVITVPLLEGLDGVKKMSKSLNNAVGLADAAPDAFGKLMSISDTLMWRYYQLLIQMKAEDISILQEQVAMGTLHPMLAKKDMAHTVISLFWSKTEADAARASFEAVFQKKDYSKAQEVVVSGDVSNPAWIVDLLKNIGAIQSSSDAKRLIESGAVIVDEAVISDFKAQIAWHSGTTIKVGKHRIYKIA